MSELEANGAEIDPYLQIPATPEESAEMERRQVTGRSYSRLGTEVDRAGLSDLFGGVYLDNQAGGLTVVLTTRPSEDLDAVVEEVLPPKTPYEIRPARHSWKSLKQAEATIVEKLMTSFEVPVSGGTVSVVSESIDVKLNTVKLVVDAGRSVDEYRGQLSDALGVDDTLLTVSEGPRTQASVGRFATTGTIYGGQRIRSNNTELACTTTGSALNSSGSYFAVTAGHCGRPFEAWRQGSMTGVLFGYGGGNGFFQYATSFCDCQPVGTIPVLKSSNKIVNAYGVLQPETSMPSQSLYFVGQISCMSGASTNGVTCGEVLAASFNHPVFDEFSGVTTGMFDQVYSSARTCGGDSGGSVVVGNTWAGIHSAGQFPFTTITTVDGFIVSCTATSIYSKLLPEYLSFYMGLTTMRIT